MRRRRRAEAQNMPTGVRKRKLHFSGMKERKARSKRCVCLVLGENLLPFL
jgi:hypothetical protein